MYTSKFSSTGFILSLVLTILIVGGCQAGTSNQTIQATLAPTVEPTSTSIRIMPLGDSITEGFCDTPDNCFIAWDKVKFPTDENVGVSACSWSMNPDNPDAVGYRAFLHDKLTEKGFQVIYVGSVSVLEGLAHEGHWAWKISDLDYCVQKAEWMNNAKPDIILLHIGTNDIDNVINGSKTVDDMTTDLSQLLKHIYEKLPKETLVIVAQIIPESKALHPKENDILVQYNTKIPGVVDNIHDEGKNVYYVDTSGAIQSDSDLDEFGYHPNTIASERIASIWASKITEILSQHP